MKKTGFSLILFLLVSFGVLTMTILLCLEPNTIQNKADFSVPTRSEIIQNIKLLMDGYTGGYTRSIVGGLIFLMIMCFFLSIGKLIFDNLIEKKDIQPKDDSKLSRSECWAIYYLVGSLATSLAWFALGNLKSVNIPTGIIMGMIGIIASAFLAQRRRDSLSGRYRLIFQNRWHQFTQLTSTEKALWCGIVLLLILFSTTAVTQPLYHDSLITHITLPTFYISEGQVMINPYHFQSFLPQNTEMLVMWALLFHSEIAAALIVWGFFAALILLLFGFLRRYTRAESALAAVFVILSSYTLVRQSFMIKNDIPLHALTIAHYILAIEAMKNRSAQTYARRLTLLSGLLCGGAVGHKLTAIPIAFFSTLAFAGNDFYEKRKNNSVISLSRTWLLGLSVSSFPWLLRSFLETGNPIYPLFNNLFTAHQEKILQYAQGTMLSTTGTADLIWYFKYMIAGVGHPRPAWGPTLLFMLLLLNLFLRKTFWPFRLWLGAAVLSSLALLISIDVRYNVGLYAFIVSLSFAFTLDDLRSQPWRIFTRWIAIIIPLFTLFQVYYRQDLWALFRTSTLVLLSGHSRGSFYSDMDNRLADEVRWTTYIVGSRTNPEERVLFAGVNYVFGLDNKLLFSSGFDKENIVEAAREVKDAADLKNCLLRKGVKHIVVGSNFFDQFKGYPLSQLDVPERDLDKIRDLFTRHATMRFATPSRELCWLTLNGDEKLAGADLNQRDALNFPLMYIAEASTRFSAGQLKIPGLMMETALKTPMPFSNKLRAIFLLAVILQKQGLLDQRKTELLSHLKSFGRLPTAAENLCLGNIYLMLREYVSALKTYGRAVELDPSRYEALNQMGGIYESSGDLKNARKFFEASIKAEPLFKEAGENLRNTARKQKEERSAALIHD